MAKVGSSHLHRAANGFKSQSKKTCGLNHSLKETGGKENPPVTMPKKAYTWNVVVYPPKLELHAPFERFAAIRKKKK